MYANVGDSSDVEAQKKATIAAWTIPYQENLHEELWSHISRLYDAENEHANMCAIIQSSGTGKSRMVDQLGTEHFVIPICLRSVANGFPPPDVRVRQYLLWSVRPARKESYTITRIGAFFQALFETAKEKIEKIICDIRPSDPNKPDMYREVSAKFRHLMTEGQFYETPNEYRMKFYDAVVEKAEDLIRPVGSQPKPEDACNKLIDLLKSLKPLFNLVFIIAFDEAATLTIDQSGDGKPPILYTLCKQLTSLNTFPFFSLFLSTASRITPFLSRTTRIVQGHLKLNSPFTGCIFDAFNAEHVIFDEGEMTVQQAASEWTMMHLGRPLWATRINKWRSDDISTISMPGNQSSESSYHDAQAKFLLRRDAMIFAIAKLLNWTGINYKWQINDDQMIACLCHRLPIEFQSASPFQDKFVEKHMRICVRLDPEDQTMVSMSSSEPVLSEASFVVMKNCVEKILPAMKIVLGGFSVNEDDQGQLVVLLILLLARDEAVSRRNTDDMWKYPRLRDAPYSPDKSHLLHPVEPKLIEWNRVFTVPDFLRALFGEIKEKQGVQKIIDSVFKDTRMHFNHFIKCSNQSVLQRQYLAGLLMRGAALLCANCQETVDAVIPFSLEDEIDRFCTGTILFQVNNSDEYTGEPMWEVCDAMEQYRLGIVDETTTNLPPVVRIVFALAASRPFVTGEVKTVNVKGGKSYTAVDIWCAGISNDILPCIQGTSSAQASWNSLLACSRQRWKALYIPPGESEVKDFLRNMTPCLGVDEPFWKFSHDVTVEKENTTQRRLGGVAKYAYKYPRRVKRKTCSDAAAVTDQETGSDSEANTSGE